MELFPGSTRRGRTWTRVHHVDLHDTGEHPDYFSPSYMKILLTDEARRAKYISRILKLLEHLYFYILHFLYVRRMW